jgi:DNA-directed RNA polymerase specialized sigma subunit
MPEKDSAQHKEAVLLLAQRIEELPGLQKKVLAMYYFENMPLADVAARLGLSKIRICQILVEISAQLFGADHGTPQLKDRQKVASDQQAESANREI